MIEPLGSHLLVTAKVGDQRLKFQTRVDFPARGDELVWLRPELDKLRFFDVDTRREIAVE